MIHPSDIAVRVLADENERLSQALKNARGLARELIAQNNILSSLLDRLARREIERSLAIGEAASLLAFCGPRMFARRNRAPLLRFGSETSWFK